VSINKTGTVGSERSNLVLIVQLSFIYFLQEGVSIDGVLDWILDLLASLTQLVITLNYSVIANFRTLQISRAHRLVFSVC
jgi:hypothetical protein